MLSTQRNTTVVGRQLSVIPNILTLFNLVFGCLAIVSVLQAGLTFTNDEAGQSLVILPENLYWASVFIGCAAIIDFLRWFCCPFVQCYLCHGCTVRLFMRCGKFWRSAGINHLPIFATGFCSAAQRVGCKHRLALSGFCYSLRRSVSSGTI